ncbi:nucleotidyltransferase-like protein [Fictibacillus aquaticus]|uniref:Nucleotidyltransferase-like domain-containing protein n=1 Tax=Fictibacillus aquaticus TaxID=2021314 RepID=A0A235F569_9BACL|nr:nucleotidyltransferase-like protein [Fictibacillus aquaticus]OYD56421.1 hypothetical protein CGZ90_15510 [Fictibacillus aquaticus]
MEDLLRPLYQERASNEGTLGVLLIEKTKPFFPATDNLDCVLFIIVQQAEKPWSIKHYEFDNKKAALHIVTEDQLNNWLLLGSNRRAVEWVLNGKVLFNRNEYVTRLRDRLHEFPIQERTKKIGLEFAKLLRRYYDGKELSHSGQYLDAFNNIMHALHHMARLAVVEHGFYPEVTVWNQVKMIEPEIYKLYEELVTGNETLDKRIELLLLASEFSLTSKTKLGASHLLNVMGEKEEWTYQELMDHPETSAYAIDLTVLLEHLIDRGFLKTIRKETKGKNLYHRYYSLQG